MNIFNKQEITTGDRIVAYIDGKCFIRDGRGKPETLVVENFRLDDLIEYIKKKNVKSVNICGIDDLSFLSECQSIERLTLTLIVELDRYDTLIKKRESEFYIWYDKVYDYQQIYDLLNLKKLAIDDAGADLLVIETMMSLQETRAALIAASNSAPRVQSTNFTSLPNNSANLGATTAKLFLALSSSVFTLPK